MSKKNEAERSGGNAIGDGSLNVQESYVRPIGNILAIEKRALEAGRRISRQLERKRAASEFIISSKTKSGLGPDEGEISDYDEILDNVYPINCPATDEKKSSTTGEQVSTPGAVKLAVYDDLEQGVFESTIEDVDVEVEIEMNDDEISVLTGELGKTLRSAVKDWEVDYKPPVIGENSSAVEVQVLLPRELIEKSSKGAIVEDINGFSGFRKVGTKDIMFSNTLGEEESRMTNELFEFFEKWSDYEPTDLDMKNIHRDMEMRFHTDTVIRMAYFSEQLSKELIVKRDLLFKIKKILLEMMRHPNKSEWRMEDLQEILEDEGALSRALGFARNFLLGERLDLSKLESEVVFPVVNDLFSADENRTILEHSIALQHKLMDYRGVFDLDSEKGKDASSCNSERFSETDFGVKFRLHVRHLCIIYEKLVKRVDILENPSAREFLIRLAFHDNEWDRMRWTICDSPSLRKTFFLLEKMGAKMSYLGNGIFVEGGEVPVSFRQGEFVYSDNDLYMLPFKNCVARNGVLGVSAESALELTGAKSIDVENVDRLNELSTFAKLLIGNKIELPEEVKRIVGEKILSNLDFSFASFHIIDDFDESFWIDSSQHQQRLLSYRNRCSDPQIASKLCEIFVQGEEKEREVSGGADEFFRIKSISLRDGTKKSVLINPRENQSHKLRLMVRVV